MAVQRRWWVNLEYFFFPKRIFQVFIFNIWKKSVGFFVLFVYLFLLKSSWKWPRAASQPCPSQLCLPSAALRAFALLQPVEVTAGTEMRMLSRQRSDGSCIFDRRKVWSATLKWVPKSSGGRTNPRVPSLPIPSSCRPHLSVQLAASR